MTEEEDLEERSFNSNKYENEGFNDRSGDYGSYRGGKGRGNNSRGRGNNERGRGRGYQEPRANRMFNSIEHDNERDADRDLRPRPYLRDVENRTQHLEDEKTSQREVTHKPYVCTEIREDAREDGNSGSLDRQEGDESLDEASKIKNDLMRIDGMTDREKKGILEKALLESLALKDADLIGEVIWSVKENNLDKEINIDEAVDFIMKN